MRLRIHRGSHEIGGSCVEISTTGSRVLIDFGMPLDFDSRSVEEQQGVIDSAKEWCLGVDAILLSHAHADHYGLFDYLEAGTAIYATAETFAMLELDGIFGTDPTRHLTRHTLRSYEPVMIGNLRVTAYPVDHSAFGASALLVEYNGTRVLYSGDIRLHGVKGVLYKRLPQDIDYLLLEGTNICRRQPLLSERDAEEAFVEAFKTHAEALHLVWCSSKNIDRICAIVRACIRTGRELVVDPFVANVLDRVSRLNPKIPSVRSLRQMKIYFPRAITSRLLTLDRRGYIYSHRPRENKVSYADITSSPHRYVMLVRPSLLDFLRRIDGCDICFTKSIWSGYWGNAEIGPFREWVEGRCLLIDDIHPSGHADVESLQRIVAHVRPRRLIPIHTDSPEQYSELFAECEMLFVGDDESVVL